jgi:NAD(P)-dependent dehydrogenase (short-subunit alcohol dehydrogenase family)
MKLKQRVALIVGGANGLGRAIAQACAREGAEVTIADSDLAAAQAAAEGIRDPQTSGQTRALHLDVTDPEAIKRTFAAVVEKHGRLDIMINCAAVCRVDRLSELTMAHWDLVFDVNARGAFFCMQAAAAAMLANKFGRIITISTPASQLAVPLFATYGASKAAVDSLTKSAAIAWAADGITVNTIVPGRMTGGMVDALDRDLARLTGQDLGQLIESRTKNLPLGRRVDPAEVANAALWLASDEAAYVTGERFNFTGGQELQ